MSLYFFVLLYSIAENRQPIVGMITLTAVRTLRMPSSKQPIAKAGFRSISDYKAFQQSKYYSTHAMTYMIDVWKIQYLHFSI